MKEVLLSFRGKTLSIEIKSKGSNTADEAWLLDILEKLGSKPLIGHITSRIEMDSKTKSITIMISEQERDKTPSIKRRAGELLQ